MKIRRSQYISMLWTNTTTAVPMTGLTPCNYGWSKDNEGILQPIWFEGSELPDCLFTDSEEGNNVTSAGDGIDQQDCDEEQSDSDSEVDAWSGDSDSDSEEIDMCG